MIGCMKWTETITTEQEIEKMATETTTTVVTETKTRKVPDMKDKPVVFMLSQEMRLADLVGNKDREGYQRSEVEQLFAELEGMGLGHREAGSLGRGNSAKFVCTAEEIPESHTITVQVRRLRANYFGKPEQADSVVMNAADSVLASSQAAPADAEVPVIVPEAAQETVADAVA